MRFRRIGRVDNHLSDAKAVAQVNKDELAMVAAAVQPAHQGYLPANIGRGKVAAGGGLAHGHSGESLLRMLSGGWQVRTSTSLSPRDGQPLSGCSIPDAPAMSMRHTWVRCDAMYCLAQASI